jgi:hypothetical protein
MRLMTVNAGGKNVRLFFPQFPSDDFPMDELDLRVARCAGGCDVVPRD